MLDHAQIPGGEEIGPFLRLLGGQTAGGEPVGVLDTVGHVGRLGVGQEVDHGAGRRACIDEDQVIVLDEGRCVGSDAAFFLRQQVVLDRDVHVRRRGGDGVRDGERAAEDAPESAGLVQCGNVAADGRVAHVKRSRQIGDSDRGLLAQRLHDVFKPFVLQHGSNRFPSDGESDSLFPAGMFPWNRPVSSS